jgi:hypothetical protein
MEIGRRELLAGAVTLSLTSLIPSLGIDRAGDEMPGSTDHQWHPLTRSLLDRASRAGQLLDRSRVECIIDEVSEEHCRPVIKWIDTPADAFDRLSQFGLDTLLDMENTKFWRRFQRPVPQDLWAFDRTFEVRMIANELLCVDEQDRLLMAPKLRAKAQAISVNLSDEEVFRVRAVSSQIGWLETSMADAAAEAVANVELLLSTGVPEGSVAIDHQLKIFETYERGLLATWETADALICVPRSPI